MTQHSTQCSDGSLAVVTPLSYNVTDVSHYVGDVLVWGQMFTPSAVEDVLARMVAHPENFDRRLLWDANGAAVR